MRTLVLSASFVLAFLALAPTPALAEDGASENDISKEIKAQMEEILRLMKSNEDALLALSTGGEGDPKKVDVKVPPPPGDQGATGRKAAKKIEELLGAQQSGSKKIPGQIEKLLEMIPT